jgi:hypothetical protein
MRRLLVRVILWPFAAAALLAQQADDAAHAWAMRHYDQVLEAVLSIQVPLDVAAKDLKWGAKLRIIPAFASESAYTLLKGFEDPVTATVTTITGGSVLTQLEGLYPRHRKTGAAKLPALIKRSTRELTVNQCPALADVARGFEDLRIPASLPDALQMDATGYQLVSEGRRGTLRLSFNAPDPAPVVEWAERLRKSVAACMSR